VKCPRVRILLFLLSVDTACSQSAFSDGTLDHGQMSYTDVFFIYREINSKDSFNSDILLWDTFLI